MPAIHDARRPEPPKHPRPEPRFNPRPVRLPTMPRADRVPCGGGFRVIRTAAEYDGRGE